MSGIHALRSALIVLFFVTYSAQSATPQWNNLGGSFTGNVAVAKTPDGRIEVFARGSDNTLRNIYQTAAGGSQWSPWASLGGNIASNPAVGVNTDGTIEVFAFGPDNALWHTRQNSAGGTSWSAWASLGGSGKNDPMVGVDNDGRLEVFFETTGDSMWHVFQNTPGGNWSGGDEILGELFSAPSVGRNSDGRLVVFTGDEDGKYWWTIQNSPNQDSWSPWWCLLGGTVSSPVVAKNANGALQLFAVRADNSVWTSAQSPAGGTSYADWSSLNGVSTSGVGVAADTNGGLELFVRGGDGGLWYTSQGGANGNFGNWASLGTTISDTPAAITDSNGLLTVFAQGSDGGLWYRGQSSPGAWSVAAGPNISSSNTLTPVWRGVSGFGSNMFVSIYGTGLASTTMSWDGSFTGGNAPTSLGGVTVMVNNKPAFIQYVSSTQINIDTPDDQATGPVSIVVQNSAGTSNTGTAMRAALSPTLLSMPTFSVGSTYYVVAETPDFGTFIGPPNLVQGYNFRAAAPGSTIIVYATGCGPTNPATAAGAMATENAPLALPYQVTIGGVTANVTFAGMVKGTVGLYQFNVVVPDVPAGDQPVSLSVNGYPNGQNLMISVGQ